MLNVHPSLLPRWRGAAPIERAIMAGDARPASRSCASLRGSTQGPSLLCERVAIEDDEDYGSLAARLAGLGGDLAVKALELHDAGDLEFTEQSEDGVTYAEKIEGSERRLDPAARRWSWSGRCGRSIRTWAPTSSSKAASGSES